MAFTASQEEILLQLIDAFKNGKKISDLPEVSGTNPFGLYAEVLDTDGESKKSSLAALFLSEFLRASISLSRLIHSYSPLLTT